MHREHTCNDRDAGEPPTEVPDESVGPQESQTLIEHGIQEGDTTPGPKDSNYRNPATQMKWLVTAIDRVLDVTTETKPHAIQAAAKEYYNESISYQQAFRCLRLLTADIKEQGHRERVPDEIRKAIVTLRVFVDPPMDWNEIERKTGIKARTAGYIFTSAEKKSGGSKDPFVLLKNATISASGPKAGSKTSVSEQAGKSDLPRVGDGDGWKRHSPTNIDSQTLDMEVHESQPRPRKRRRQDDMIDPNLDVSIRLAPAMSDVGDGDMEGSSQEPESTDMQDMGDDEADDGDTINTTPPQADTTSPTRRKARPRFFQEFPADAVGVEERVFRALGGHR